MNTYISYPAAFCKTASADLSSILSNSNSIPHIWYHKVLHKNGKPDNVGITILSELLQLYLVSETSEREFQLGYNYFKVKFNYTCEQVYMALVRLDESSLISRKTKSGNNINDLFLTLKVENLLALHVESNNKSDEDKHTNPATSLTTDTSPNIDLYIDITEDIEVKREENYISSALFENKLRTDKNTPEQKLDQETNPDNNAEGIIKTAKKWAKSLTRKPISSFHPLTEEDAEQLRLSSDREFNLHFINQLVLRLSEKYPNHSFYTKKLFLKYMVLTLANEKRQAVNVNNEGFRFKRSDDEGIAEEYLTKVEDDYATTVSSQIRKKIAASFEPTVAYKILTSCYFPNEATQDHYEIKQRLQLELSTSQQDRLHSQIFAVFGDSVKSIEITENFKAPIKSQYTSTTKDLRPVALDTTTLWGRIRSGLIATYGEAIDKSWFSRLETTEDASSRSLILKGASFLTDYIQTNYSHMIERLCREENYQLKFC